jgi:hypothetical protein
MRARCPGGDGLAFRCFPGEGGREEGGAGLWRGLRPTPPVPLPVVTGLGVRNYEPDVDPLLEPETGGAPSGGAPDPDGGVVPVPDFDPLPMSGQFLVEPDPGPVEELEEPVPLFPEPVLLPVLELGAGAVGGDEPELLPELPVVDVVAALATSAPPATRPEVSAPTAKTLRRRICMVVCPFVCVDRRPVRTGTGDDALRI